MKSNPCRIRKNWVESAADSIHVRFYFPRSSELALDTSQYRAED